MLGNPNSRYVRCWCKESIRLREEPNKNGQGFDTYPYLREVIP